MEAGRPPGPEVGAARGPAADRPGTDTPGTRGRTRGHARRGAGRRRVASRLMPAEGGRRGAGGPRPTPGRAGRRGAVERGRRPLTRAGRRRVASRPIRRSGSQGTRAGRGRRRNRQANAQPEGGRPFSPPSLPFGNFSRRPSPPTDSWGRRPPRGGHDARPTRPRMGPGRAQAPRRPHDTGRPTEGLAGIRGCRRPDRGGRPLLGDGGPSPDGPWRPGRGVAWGSGSVCPHQRLEAPACVEFGLAISNGQNPTALRAALCVVGSE